MKRIILTVTTDLTYDQRMIRIATTLSEEGYDVVLVGREKSDSLSLVDRSYQQVRLSCKYEKGKLFYLEFNYLLYKYLLGQSMDIVCAVDLDTILPVTLIAQRKGIPSVFDAHEYFEEVPEVVNRPVIKKMWETISHFCIPRFTKAYTVSQGLADIFTKKYRINFDLVRNVPITGTEIDTIKINTEAVEKVKAIAAKSPVILYQGALNEGRGLLEMVEAMTYLQDVVLILVGDGDIGTELHARVVKNYLHDQVVFLGYQKPETLRAITPFATLGLNLLENKGLSYYYSLANKTFDYIRASVPALHSDFPEYRYLLGEYETGVLLKTLEPLHLASTIEETLKNKDRLEYYRDNCRLAKKKYTWDNEKEKLINIYRDLS